MDTVAKLWSNYQGANTVSDDKQEQLDKSASNMLMDNDNNFVYAGYKPVDNGAGEEEDDVSAGESCLIDGLIKDSENSSSFRSPSLSSGQYSTPIIPGASLFNLSSSESNDDGLVEPDESGESDEPDEPDSRAWSSEPVNTAWPSEPVNTAWPSEPTKSMNMVWPDDQTLQQSANVPVNDDMFLDVNSNLMNIYAQVVKKMRELDYSDSNIYRQKYVEYSGVLHSISDQIKLFKGSYCSYVFYKERNEKQKQEELHQREQPREQPREEQLTVRGVPKCCDCPPRLC